MTKPKESRLAVFDKHGFIMNGESGDNVYGECAFCGGEDKMYVNPKTYLWDCKKCNRKGNIQTFMDEVGKRNHDALINTDRAINRLVEYRGLPPEAFTEIEDFGWDGVYYTLVVRDGKGKPVDVRTFSPKQKYRARSTKTCTSGLFGHEQLSLRSHKDYPVYFCEGEWDGIALKWLHAKLRIRSVIVATGGSDVFKVDWVESFNGRNIYLMYDNDVAGERGELQAKKRIGGFAANIQYLHWLPELPTKFDLRDWILKGAVENLKPRKCWTSLRLLFKDVPRSGSPEDHAEGGELEEGYEPIEYGSVTPEDVFAVFSKWLHMKNDEPLAIMFGTMLANLMQGDPLWVFLIAPPGGMKSELLMALGKVKKAHLSSSLTPHALVSGCNFGAGGDPSLLPKLDGKVLVLKDFTTILSMHPTARDEIFGQLRDSYDGKFEKMFGNGIVRNYESKFGIIGGCTPNIDAFSSLHAGLGERFLKYRFEGEITEEDEEGRIRRALLNVNKENSMRDDLQNITKEYFNQQFPSQLPEIPIDIVNRLVPLAMLTAKLRGVVHRDQYNQNMLHAKSSSEVGTRISKQLSKLAMGIAMYYQKQAVDVNMYHVVMKVAMGSLADKREEFIRVIITYWRSYQTPVTITQLEELSPSLTRSTIQRIADDMVMLKVVHNIGSRGKGQYKPTDYIIKLANNAEVWLEPTPKKKRVLRKKKILKRKA